MGYAGYMNSGWQEHFAKRLRDARKEASLTQQQVAAHFSLTRQAVSGWETGRHVPTLPQFYELCILYGMGAEWMLFGMRTVPASTKPVMKHVFGANAEEQKG